MAPARPQWGKSEVSILSRHDDPFDLHEQGG